MLRYRNSNLDSIPENMRHVVFFNVYLYVYVLLLFVFLFLRFIDVFTKKSLYSRK